MPSVVQGTLASAANWVIALNIQPMNSWCKIRRSSKRDCMEKSLTDCKHIFNSSCSLRFICELGVQVCFLFGTHCRIFIVNIWIFNLKAKAFWLKSLMNPIGLDSPTEREATRQAASLRTYVRQHNKLSCFLGFTPKPDDGRAEELTKVMLKGFGTRR